MAMARMTLRNRWHRNFPYNEIFIYNRWGAEVFNAIDYRNDWYGTFKGKDLPDGTYFYVFIDRTNGKVVSKGHLTIHR